MKTLSFAIYLKKHTEALLMFKKPQLTADNVNDFKHKLSQARNKRIQMEHI